MKNHFVSELIQNASYYSATKDVINETVKSQLDQKCCTNPKGAWGLVSQFAAVKKVCFVTKGMKI